MAYRSPQTTRNNAVPGQQRLWEDLRKEARKMEGELDVKLAAYAKMCASVESSYKYTADEQLFQSKAREIEELLTRLSDINDEMGGAIGGSTDARSHQLTRHRDILQDFNQEFRKVSSSMGSAKDRMALFSGVDRDTAPLLSVQVQGSSGALLRERSTIQSSTSAMDDMLSQAAVVSSNLQQQRQIFDNVFDKLLAMGSKFPVIGGLLGAIRRRKNMDTLVISGVISVCLVFTIIYLWYK